MRSTSVGLGGAVAQPPSIQDQALEQSAQGSYSAFLIASNAVSSGSLKQGSCDARQRSEIPSDIRLSELPWPGQIMPSETLKERLRRETIEALDREWERGALPDEELRGCENVDSGSEKQGSSTSLEKPVSDSRETSSCISESDPKANQRKTVWRISMVEIYQVENPVPQTRQLPNPAMDFLISPPTLDRELGERSCSEPTSEQEQDIGQDSVSNQERTWVAPSDTFMETDPLPLPLFSVGRNMDQQRNLRQSFSEATSQPLKRLRLEDYKTTYNLGNTVDAWNISTAHELHDYVCAAANSCDEKGLNRLISFEGGSETVADPLRSPYFGYLHQRHVERGKQDPCLDFIQNLDCAYNVRVRSNRTFQPNQIVILDTNQENVLVPTYQENIPDQYDNSIDRLSNVRRMG